MLARTDPLYDVSKPNESLSQNHKVTIIPSIILR